MREIINMREEIRRCRLSDCVPKRAEPAHEMNLIPAARHNHIDYETQLDLIWLLTYQHVLT